MAYETQRFNDTFTRILQQSLSWAETTQFLVLIPIYLRSILIRLGLPKILFPVGVPVNILEGESNTFIYLIVLFSVTRLWLPIKWDFLFFKYCFLTLKFMVHPNHHLTRTFRFINPKCVQKFMYEICGVVELRDNCEGIIINKKLLL